MNIVAHAIVAVAGIAAAAILAATHTISSDVAVPLLTTFVGYGAGAGVVTATTTKTPA